MVRLKSSCDDGSVHLMEMLCLITFQCTECGAIIDLDFNDFKPEKALVSAATNQFDGIIEGSVSFFYGKCPKCSKKQK